jgi:hypothetical protein
MGQTSRAKILDYHRVRHKFPSRLPILRLGACRGINHDNAGATGLVKRQETASSWFTASVYEKWHGALEDLAK